MLSNVNIFCVQCSHQWLYPRNNLPNAPKEVGAGAFTFEFLVFRYVVLGKKLGLECFQQKLLAIVFHVLQFTLRKGQVCEEFFKIPLLHNEMLNAFYGSF